MTTAVILKTINIQPRSNHSPDFCMDEVPELESERIPSLKIKQQTLFPDEDDNAQTKPNSSNARSLAQQEQIDLPSPDVHLKNTPKSGVLSDNGKEEGVVLSEEAELPANRGRTQDNVDALPPLDTSPQNEPGKSFLKLNFLRRQDSNPMVMKDFNQIESNFEGDGNLYTENESPLNGVNSPDRGFVSVSNSTIVTSKFAPDRPKKNNSQVTFLFKSPKQNMFKESFASPRSARDDPRSEDREAKRKWNKLSHVFRSIMMFRSHEVKSINDPAAIYDEISEYQLRQLNEKRNRAWDISKQDFARDAFQNLRRVEVFCDCATVGSIKQVQFMNELIEKDPKRYLLEPDDPAYLTNCRNSRGHTPMYIAAKHGNMEVIKLLLKWKANYLIPSQVSLTDKKTELPLEVAARWGHEEVVRYLLDNCKFEATYVKKCLTQTEYNGIKNILKEYLKRPGVKKGWRIVTKLFG